MKNFRNVLLVLIIGLLLQPLHVCAQQQVQASQPWGLIGGWSYSMHNGGFSKLGDYPSCCPSFTYGTGNSFHLGVLSSLPLASSLALEARLIYTGENGTFGYDQQSVVADLRDTVKTVRATFHHELSSGLSSLGLEPVLTYTPARNLEILMGARLAYVLTSSFKQSETLTQPEDYGAYLGTGRIWVSTDAPIPSASSLRFSLMAALRLRLPLREPAPINLLTELSYFHGLNPIASTVDWNLNQVRMSMVVGFKHREPALPSERNPTSEPAIVVAEPPVITPRPNVSEKSREYKPSPSISIYTIDGSDTTTVGVKIYEREQRVTMLHPLLGYVYFDEGSSQLPQRYQIGVAKAFKDTLHLLPLEALQGEMGIIALRMKARPGSKLTITGTTAKTSGDNGLFLARARAETVKRTMMELGIEEYRLEVATRLYPEEPTTVSDAEFQRQATEENRRVELQCTDAPVFYPIMLGTTKKNLKPEYVGVKLDHVEELKDTTLWMRARRGNEIVFERTGSKAVDSIMWIRMPDKLPEGTQDTLTFELFRVSDGSAKPSARTVVPIVHDVNEKLFTSLKGDIEIERYGLILFEFDNIRVAPENEYVLGLIRKRIRENTSVKIIGATDVIGSNEYNRDLSYRRAKEVAKRLGVQKVSIQGSGENDPSFPNELPEGRASNRTVIIELATPVR